VEQSGLEIDEIREFEGRAELVASFPKMAKYVGWPMLLAFRLKR
jgi:hypothetical protein